MTNLNSSLEDVKNIRVAVPEPVALPAPVSIPAPVPAPAAPVALMPMMQGLNLTRRAQILRMRKRGENLQSIAAALQLPVGEVTLMLKMESLQNAAVSASADYEPKPMARAAARGIL